MSKLFISIEGLIAIDRDGMIIKRPLPFLILAGYLRLDNLGVLMEKKYEKFSKIGRAIALFNKEMELYKNQRNKKLILLSILLILVTVLVILVSLEIKIKYLIKYQFHMIISYCLLAIKVLVLLYITLSIIRKIVNIIAENRAISRQLERMSYIEFQSDKAKDGIMKQLYINEAIVYNTIKGKTTENDIQYLYNLYYELSSNSNKSGVDDLHNYLLLFLEKKYLDQSIRRNCKELLSQWRFQKQNICNTKLADSVRDHNIVIAKQIIYQLFNEINCYTQYTSLIDFIKHGILNIKSSPNKTINSNLLLSKLEEFDITDSSKNYSIDK